MGLRSGNWLMRAGGVWKRDLGSHSDRNLRKALDHLNGLEISSQRSSIPFR